MVYNIQDFMKNNKHLKQILYDWYDNHIHILHLLFTMEILSRKDLIKKCIFTCHTL
jgi:hypothetical protein